LLIEGVRSWGASVPVVVPQKSAFSKARARVGSAPLKRLFEETAVPLAEEPTRGAWYRAWRVMSMDGSTLEVPDTPENAAHFGRPGVSRGERRAYPRVRWVALGKVGTRAIVGLEAGAYIEGEQALARPLLARLAPDMLCLCDRAYFGSEAWEAARATGAALLWRLKKNAVFTVEERLADGSYLPSLPGRGATYRRRRSGNAQHAVVRNNGYSRAATSLSRVASTGATCGRATSRSVTMAMMAIPAPRPSPPLCRTASAFATSLATCGSGAMIDSRRIKTRDRPATRNWPHAATGRVMKGGSHLCHASSCNRYRVAVRTHGNEDDGLGHLGFRVAYYPC